MSDDYDHLHRWEPPSTAWRHSVPDRALLDGPIAIASAILIGFAVAALILGIAWGVAILTHPVSLQGGFT